MRYRGIIFDMDGTLTVPSLDFDEIRQSLGLSPEIDIMVQIESLPDDARREAWEVIERYEEEVIGRNKLQEGCRETLMRFREAGIKLGILTRNTSRGVDAFIELIEMEFDAVLTREHEHVKPSPIAVSDILRQWAIAPEEALVVGDYIHDIEAGRGAGARTCFFHNPGTKSFAGDADFAVSTFSELEDIVRGGGPA